MTARYDSIGAGYAIKRREDLALRARIHSALGEASTVANVGAGTGSYEPADRRVIAIEPSAVMVAQRVPSRAMVLRAGASGLPLRDGSVDAAMAVLTIHHWDDALETGVRELRRISRGPIVIVTFDATVSANMWLCRDYLPEVAALDRRIFPPLDLLTDWLGGSTNVEIVATSRDTTDWTLASFWAHPERVFDEAARKATSGFARLDPKIIDRVVADLRRDLDDGTWADRHGHLRSLDSYDVGMRLVIAQP